LYAPTAEDRNLDAQTLVALASAGQISRLTAVKAIADVYDIADVGAEIKQIDNEEVA